jgi:hypothetical protein
MSAHEGKPSAGPRRRTRRKPGGRISRLRRPRFLHRGIASRLALQAQGSQSRSLLAHADRAGFIFGLSLLALYNLNCFLLEIRFGALLCAL